MQPAYRRAGRERELEVECDNLCCERRRERYRVRWRAQHAADVDVDRIDSSEVESGIRASHSIRGCLAVYLDVCGISRASVYAEIGGGTPLAARRYSLLTTAVSSPGSTATFSPIWTIPLSIRPETPSPDSPVVCPLKTFARGNLKGASNAREGTLKVSARERCLRISRGSAGNRD